MHHRSLPLVTRGELNCDDFKALASDYIDGQLTAVMHRRCKEHLASCDNCCALVLDLQAIVKAAKTLEREIPADVAGRLRAKILGTGPTHVASRLSLVESK